MYHSGYEHETFIWDLKLMLTTPVLNEIISQFMIKGSQKLDMSMNRKWKLINASYCSEQQRLIFVRETSCTHRYIWKDGKGRNKLSLSLNTIGKCPIYKDWFPMPEITSKKSTHYKICIATALGIISQR